MTVSGHPVGAHRLTHSMSSHSTGCRPAAVIIPVDLFLKARVPQNVALCRSAVTEGLWTQGDDCRVETAPCERGFRDTMTAETTPTDAQTACFEAGIKFGSLYHQFAGTPVTPASAPSLARAMEEAIENQPHCVDVTVDVNTQRLAETIESGSATYTELSGEFFDVELTVEYEGVTVVAEMELVDGYPLMSLETVENHDR